MFKRIVYHIVFNKEKKSWRVKKEGVRSPVKSFMKKETAVRFGRKIGRKEKLGQLKVHGRNGRIQQEYTYGSDPRRYPS